MDAIMEKDISTETNTKIAVINEKSIRNKIYIIREQQVMLDFELAEIYGYETKTFNQQVIRNIEKFDSDLYYYTFDRNEIDFVIQYKNNIIPIEVKASVSTNNNSLTKFNKENDNNISIRLSLNNLKQDGKIINIPLYLVEYIDKFIG